MESLVIVGASLAGLSAARAARNLGFEGRVVIIGDDHQRPYDRPPLSKDFLAGRIELADLALETDDEALDAEWILGTRAVSFDPATRLVHLENGATVHAAGLVVATGASPRVLPQIAEAANVVSLRTVADAQKLRGLLSPGRRLVVVGAGFIGAEVASTAHALGLEVTVLEKSPTPLCGPLGTQLGAVVAGLHERAGVELICGAEIADFALTDGSVTAVHLAGGRVLDADVVLVGIGAVPNTAWLESSGIELGNGVLCDATGATSIPGVVAVGDCAAWWDPATTRHHRVEHWTGAAQRPAVAVAALLGRRPRDPARGQAPLLLVRPVRHPPAVRRRRLPRRPRGLRARRPRPGLPAGRLLRRGPPRGRARLEPDQALLPLAQDHRETRRHRRPAGRGLTRLRHPRPPVPPRSPHRALRTAPSKE